MKEMVNKIFERLEKLYHAMDTAWDRAALSYGFRCNGCDENCCETEFYHHTSIEKAYLLHGFNQLPLPLAIASKKRAQKVVTKRNIAAKKGGQIRIMCPLNLEERCSLYRFRPMICRLHGIPHELTKPGSLPVKSPGCNAGSDLFGVKYIQFDRTRFYSEMATIEMDYLNIIGKTTRNRETIAHMLLK